MNKIRLTIVLIFTLIGGVSLFGLFHGDKPVPVVQNPLPSLLQPQIGDAQTRYEQKADALASTNKKLAAQLKNRNRILEQLREDNRVLQQKMEHQLDKEQTDTAAEQKLEDCNSIRKTAEELMQSSAAVDSIYMEAEWVMVQQLDNKDSVIALQQAAKEMVTLQLNASISQQFQLNTQIEIFQKQLVRQQGKNKLLTAGILVLSGIAIYGLLQH